VPSGHVYVRHLSDPSGSDNVVRLVDPRPPGAPEGQWWPHPMLEACWVTRHAADFDVFHVHFGYEHRSPQQLHLLVGALRAAGRPLVVTVHDLRNPHHVDPRPHEAALDILLPAADAVVTLSAGAAREIACRWHRRATVIPHPHVVEFDRMGRTRPSHTGLVVGLHAKSERANNQSVAVARALHRVIADLDGARLRIDVHDDPAGAAVAAALAGLDVRVHPRFSDEQLWDYLCELDVSVLPYRFGTHSGWFEACRDLGTTVLAPTCGYYAEQGPCLVYRHDERSLDEKSLADALRTAITQRPHYGAGIAFRRQQRKEVSMAHRRVYEAALRARHAAAPGR
jgi:hypothetical protein